jgi:zinc protease
MTVTREGAPPLLLLSAKLPGYLHPDYVPARFLKELLAGWLTRRLVTEEQVAVAADVFHTSLIERSLLRIRVRLVEPDLALEARDALLSLLREVRGPRFRFPDVLRVADYLHSREILVEEDLRGLAGLIGRAALAGYYDGEGPPEHLAAPDRYRRVTDAEVRRVARAYLTPSNLRVLFLLPPGSATPDPPRLSGETGAGRFADPVSVARIEAETSAPGSKVRDAVASRTTLSNGTVLVHLRRPGSRVAACSIVFRGGSRFDPPGREGLAALTLRSLELATKEREGGELRWRRFSMGNRWGAAVDRETARVTFVVPRESMETALRATTEMLTRPAFTEAAIEEARGRLESEIRRNLDTVSGLAGATFTGALFDGSPYGHEPRGTSESLAGLTANHLREFHDRNLRLDRAVVALVGDLTPEGARDLVEEAMSRPPSAPFRLPAPAPGEPPPAREIRVSHPSDRGYLILGGPAPSLGDAEFARASLLRLALGWLVFDELTNVRSVAYEAGAFHRAYLERGALGIHAGADPTRLGEIRKVLLEILSEVRESGVDPDLVADARGAWLGGAALTSVRSDLVATRLAYREALGLGHASFDALRAQVEGLTAADLKDLCRSLLSPDRLTTVLVNPR